MSASEVSGRGETTRRIPYSIVPRVTPRAAAVLIATIIGLSFAYDLLRMPVQLFDSLQEMLDEQRSPSAYATFVGGLTGTAYLRPLRLAQIKVLFDLADGHYWLVYRGFHAALLLAAVLLFVRALDVRTWADCAAGAFALTVLTGLHTFGGTVREAFPINHFLEMVVLCLFVLNLARSRGGWLIDVAAAAAFVVASLTLESGLLVAVVVITAWVSGMRGISRRGVAAVAMLLGAYLWARFWYLSTGTPGLMERSSGFLLNTLDPEELVQRFGDNPTWFYAYNVAASMMSVLFSEPQAGVFQFARSWLDGDVPPRLYMAVVSSAFTTGLIVWAAGARLFRRIPHARAGDDQLLVVFAVMLVANATLSFAYTKDEVISVAGAFYACAAFVAARYVLGDDRPSSGRVARVLLCVMLSGVATLWACRSVGTHHALRVQAFKHRNDWARLEEGRYLRADSPYYHQGTALMRQLRREALDMPVPNPELLPPWVNRWWGE